MSDSKITLVKTENTYKNTIVALNNAMYVAFAPQYTIKKTETFNYEHNYLPVSLVKITDYKDISNLPDAVYNATLTTQVEKTEVLKNYVFKKFPYTFDESINLAYEKQIPLNEIKIRQTLENLELADGRFSSCRMLCGKYVCKNFVVFCIIITWIFRSCRSCFWILSRI